ncbi:MAG: protein translocase subunit SecD [Verrucomicrobiales bacterium]|nr:protein translocase subunit SecD [Verrucomicrobiales bacterium]
MPAQEDQANESTDAATAPAEAAAADAPATEAPAAEAPAAVESTAPIIEDTPSVTEEAGEAAVETVEAVESATQAIQEAASTGVSSQMTFLLGLGLLALFVYYFATESSKRKRMAGTALAVFITGLSVWLYSAIGLEKGIELQGGVSMQIKIIPSGEGEITPTQQQQVIDVLNKRLNSLGTSEVILAPQGEDGIFLQMPGVGQEKLKEIEEILEQVAKLEFSILHPQSNMLAAQVAAGGQVVPGYEALPYKPDTLDDGSEGPITRYGLVKIKRDMEGENVSRAGYFYGDSGHSISVSFTSDGAKIMGPLTRENTNQPLAIIMDDVILSSPVIREPFAQGCSITGDFSRDEAQALASALENPLENPIEIEYSNFISPTMGEATIKQGILAGVAGLALTLLFILIYYRFAGILALLGLGISIAIIFGTMAMFQFTLTLPGIAGIILTIGVAIDANVLIYERLREELAAGKSLKAAIDTAYEKAFSAIIDANITTLITAIILYALAAGTVKGFAITLIIGIFATLFSSLLVTRVCFNWATESNFLKKLSFMNMVPENAIDFLGKRKACLFASLIVLVVSLIVVPTMDPRGVELKGGDSITIQSAEDLSVAKISESLSSLDLGGEPIVQAQSPVGADGEFFLIRSADNTADQIVEHLQEDLGVKLEDTTVASVGSAVGKSMLISSGIALLIGIAAILVYVTFRFEFAFALGAIAALFHDLIVVAGITTLLGQEFTLITVGAFLTIAGYSINDTIVVFDRVREGLATKRGDIKDIMNDSLNRTLARTLLTSLTTLITVVVLFIFGGPGLRNFAETLIIGVLIGTYSSIFIACPIVLWWARKSGTNLRREVLDAEMSKVEAVGTQA